VKNKRQLLLILIICLTLAVDLACTKGQPTLSAPTRSAAPAPLPTAAPTLILPTMTTTFIPLTPSPTAPVSGPALTAVQFALDIDESGNLIFPATEFVSGVARVYVRFAYQDFNDFDKIETRWYLNGNWVSGSMLDWDGGEDGEYVIWIEDPTGLARGQWRWELVARDEIRGGGAFSIGGEPRYINEAWGVSLDPPATWSKESEETDFVTFSSSDRRQALAVRVASGVTELSELAAANLELFSTDHPEAEVVLTEDVTMNGEPALLQQVRYSGQGEGQEFVFIVSALHAGVGYSLWVLGPADDVDGLQVFLADTLLSMRFSEKD
jgi:hypothetical protein